MTTEASSTPTPTEPRLPRVWHGLRGWLDRVTSQSIVTALDGTAKTEAPGWRAPRTFSPAPGPAEVLPALPNRSLRIECLPSTPADSLATRVKNMCETRRSEGLQLTSTFSHDGSIFLVFKRL